MILSERAIANRQKLRDKKNNIFTPDVVDEIITCANNPIHFINAYSYTEGPSGLSKLSLYRYQENQIDIFEEHENVICAQARCTGATTISCFYLMWIAMFSMNKSVAIIAANFASVGYIKNILTTLYHNLPIWLRPTITRMTPNSMSFDNGSRIHFINQASNISGLSFDNIYLDNYSHLGFDEQQKLWYTMVPHISRGTKVIISGTPNGSNNIFTKIWQDTLSGNPFFYPLKITIDDCPQFDHATKQTMQAQMSVNHYKRMFECDFDA